MLISSCVLNISENHAVTSDYVVTFKWLQNERFKYWLCQWVFMNVKIRYGGGQNSTPPKTRKRPSKQKQSDLEWIVAKADGFKQKMEPGLDKVLATTAVNLGAIYGASELIDQGDFSNTTNAAIMLGTGAAIAAGNYFIFKSDSWAAKFLRNIGNKAFDLSNRSRLFSLIKTGALAVAIYSGASQLKPYYDQIYDDISASLNPSKRLEQKLENETLDTAPATPSIKRPEVYDNLQYKSLIEHDFAGVDLDEKGTLNGKIQRTMRWQPIYQAIEKVYGIPTNTLGAIIMQESMGDPMQPNVGKNGAVGDGGFGAVHFQGKTAKQWGLKIYGTTSDDYSDPKHGKQIEQMLKDCKYDLKCAQEKDDRAHIIKNLDATARIIAETAKRKGSVNAGIMAVRGSRSMKIRRDYLRSIQKWRTALNSPTALDNAEEDFNTRNMPKGFTWDKYIVQWHEMSNNWGLNSYLNQMSRHSVGSIKDYRKPFYNSIQTQSITALAGMQQPYLDIMNRFKPRKQRQ
jgi:hypothetical protein